jgi:hypothetical protein
VLVVEISELTCDYPGSPGELIEEVHLDVHSPKWSWSECFYFSSVPAKGRTVIELFCAVASSQSTTDEVLTEISDFWDAWVACIKPPQAATKSTIF